VLINIQEKATSRSRNGRIITLAIDTDVR
jgi:hypothetical protein